MRQLLTITTLALASLSLPAQANDLHSVIVGAATGAAGAAIGQSVGGRDGAIIGGAIGGATGAVIAAKSRPQTVVVQQEARPDYRRPRHGHSEYRTPNTAAMTIAAATAKPGGSSKTGKNTAGTATAKTGYRT
jgi:hypothetical protein